eukprot:CAMPEP_0113949562 /NCGR_PEP_ID=MMETSP1339-20121228/76208_1 /TAXON_ID=94617 /ORGANISM="Fibrocapsa japonica" /LENGTH=258 /DNA_ID=CAMNT_0000957053 /DNA_START=254 /DNA_END=1030 /DNA_ORIENTATION=- /assembly_acc=CAM_ASM_000762
MRVRILDVPPQQCITADNAPLQADAIVFFQIIDLHTCFYSIQDVQAAIENLVLTQLRAEIGKVNLDDTFTMRERLAANLVKETNDITSRWGVLIKHVELRDIQPNAAIQASMEQQMSAERKKRASILESEGDRAASINRAEGNKQSQILEAEGHAKATAIRAQGEADRCRIEAQGLANALAAVVDASSRGDNKKPLTLQDAARFLLAREFLQTQATAAASNNTKLLLLPSVLETVRSIGLDTTSKRQLKSSILDQVDK